MDSKVTLSFNSAVIEHAKQYAAENNISLSRLTEMLLSKVTSKNYASLEDYPISDWVSIVSEGEVEYITTPKSKKKLKEEFFKNKK
jgi:hypothetical protein